MKHTTRNSEAYSRPGERRFTPSEWEKSAVRVDWIDCDPVAMYAVESASGITWGIYTDRHGYPAS